MCLPSSSFFSFCFSVEQISALFPLCVLSSYFKTTFQSRERKINNAFSPFDFRVRHLFPVFPIFLFYSCHCKENDRDSTLGLSRALITFIKAAFGFNFPNDISHAGEFFFEIPFNKLHTRIFVNCDIKHTSHVKTNTIFKSARSKTQIHKLS